jgi:hypothetical protein
MTAIVGFTWRGLTVQATDRLLTQHAHGVPLKRWDALSNKAILLATEDAVVSVGYTGTAHIGGMTTDTWIAGILADTDLSDLEGLMPWRFPGMRRLPTCVIRLQHHLSELVVPDDFTLMVQIIGSRVTRRRRFTPVIGLVERHGAQDAADRLWQRDFGDWTKTFNVSAVPRFGRDELDDIARDLEAAAPDREAIERTLVAAVRRLGDRHGTVGHDVLTVASALAGRAAWVRFWPHASSDADVPLPDVDRATYAFSPWLLTPEGVAAPQIGNLPFGNRFLRPQFRGLPSEPPRLWLQQHPRKPWR